MFRVVIEDFQKNLFQVLHFHRIVGCPMILDGVRQEVIPLYTMAKNPRLHIEDTVLKREESAGFVEFVFERVIHQEFPQKLFANGGVRCLVDFLVAF